MLGICVKKGDNVKFKEMLCADSKIQGKSSKLTSDEENIIVERLMFAERRGFSLDNKRSRSIMTQIVSNGRQTSDDTIRSFRARNSELKYGTHEQKSVSKLAAEDASHISCHSRMF